MKIGMIGLGKMGANMTQRLLQGGHQVVVFDLNKEAVATAVAHGAIAAPQVTDFPTLLDVPSVVWVMVPAGGPLEEIVANLAEVLAPGDIIVDGGNNNYQDTMRRARWLYEKGVYFVDVGTSGGVWGLEQGYSMMVGGHEEAVAHLRPVLETLAPAPDQGWGHVGPSGAGHFVKMVHNGIEYGLMQAYAEGFEILKTKESFDLDLYQVADIWRSGSVIRSWLLELTANALADDPHLSDIRGWVDDSGTGRWTVFEAIDLDIPAPVITAALQARFVSRQEESYAAKLLAAMRNQFGGHAVKSSE